MSNNKIALIFLKMFLIILISFPVMIICPLINMYICQSPSTCVDILSCAQPSILGLTMVYCGFGLPTPKVCCLQLKSNDNSSKRDVDLEVTTMSARVIRRNDDVVHHKNFHFLPMDECGVVSSYVRITSGSSTSPGEFPWMALIAYKTGNSTSQRDFKCGGTLITEKYVLTAAHCIDNSTIFGVRLGEYDTTRLIDCDMNGRFCQPPVQDFEIAETIKHPFYDPSTFINDIGLIRLASAVNYTNVPNIRPICLPFDELLDASLEGHELTVSGWGATDKGNKSTILRKVFVPVVPIESCRKLYEPMKPITKKQLCAGGDHGRDSCAGDSGGPLKRVDLINNSPRYVQYGIVSFGPSRCGLSTRPGVYTNVQKYVRWILDRLAD